MSDHSGAATGILSPFLPADPLMAQAWVDCLRWAMGKPEIREAFRRESGMTLEHSWLPIEQTIDTEGDADEAIARRFVAWFDANVWGNVEGEDAP